MDFLPVGFMSHTRWSAPIVVDLEVGVCTWVQAKSVKYESRCFSPFCCHFLYCSFLNFLVPLLLKVWIFVICIISSLHEVVEIPRAIRFENIFSEGLQYIISSTLPLKTFLLQGQFHQLRRMHISAKRCFMIPTHWLSLANALWQQTITGLELKDHHCVPIHHGDTFSHANAVICASFLLLES